MRPKIYHVVAEFCGCDPKLLLTSPVIKRFFEETVKKAKLTKIRSYYHQFSPYGVTGVVLLKESHMSIHTWPEFGYAAVDIFGCGDKKTVNDACKILAEFLKPTRLVKNRVKRGII